MLALDVTEWEEEVLDLARSSSQNLNVAGHVQTQPCLRKVVIMHAEHQYEAAHQCQHNPGSFATMVVMQVPQVTTTSATASEVICKHGSFARLGNIPISS